MKKLEIKELDLMSLITPTAIELWNDKRFIEKRIDEQKYYISSLTSEQLSDRCTRSIERFNELVSTASKVYQRLENRLRELEYR